MWQQIQQTLALSSTTLVAVSKNQPLDSIMTLYRQGQRVFGENKVQELLEKQEALPKDIEWHLIGHLQKNKVKYIAPFVTLIHSLDSPSLMNIVHAQGKKCGRLIHGLLQFKIAEEDSKTGANFEEMLQFLQGDSFKSLTHLQIDGVMGMASFTDDETQIRREFDELMRYFEMLKKSVFKDAPHFKEISCGMSSDYKIALEAGSTMVRIGTLLFGSR